MPKKLTIIAILIVFGGIGWGVWATSNPHTWTSGLVGYWSFDGQYTTSTAGTRDVSNNGNWGAFNGGVKPIGGISGQALSFDGVDDYVEVADANTLDLTTAGTVEMWIKGNAIADEDNFMWKTNAYGLTHGFTAIGAASGKFNFAISSGGWKYVNSITSPSNNVWYHVVGVSDGTNIKIFVNGIQENSATGGTIGVSANVVWIGASGTVAGRQFDGLIDEVRIYSRALSADEVKQHYDQTRRNLIINNPSGTPPVGWWKMDEGTGQTVRDYSVNAYNGTPTGTASVDGKIGKALSFNGSSDYVDLGTWFNYQEFTISMWVNSGSSQMQYADIIDNNHDGDSNWVLQQDNLNTNVYGFSNLSFTLTANVWQHLSIVRAGTTCYIYIDDNLVDTDTCWPSGINYDSSPSRNLRFGCHYTMARYWNGLMDDVRIYNYARTADQIATDFRAGAYRTIIATSVPSNWWTNGLVGYWNFDGQNTTTTSGANAGTRDASGSGNWGTFYNRVKPVGGISGQALSFDGVDDHVDSANNTGITGNNARTIEFWVKLNTTADATPIVSIGSLNSDKLWSVVNGTAGQGKWTVWGYNGANDFTTSASSANDLGSWVFISATNNGTQTRVYRNGVDIGGITYTYNTDNSVVYIGYVPGWGTYFNGLIDEVRIYNRALGADEVMMHYQQTRRNLGL